MSTDKPVIIYTKIMCLYCTRTKKLLDKKGVGYHEINVTFDRTAHAEMIKRSGGRLSAPQIFIGDAHVGGNDELQALHDQGKLDALLG